MSALLEQLLTHGQRTEAAFADFAAARAAAHAAGPQHRMGELERARTGIDIKGQPLRSAGVSAAEKAALFDPVHAFAFEAVTAAAPSFIVPRDPMEDIGDLLCERASDRQADAQDAAEEARDCNGNERSYW